MTVRSKYFDRIRISREEARPIGDGPRCEWSECAETASHRAPKGRMREGEYHHFCIDHVRLYNKSYNYFAGMRDEDVSAYQKDSTTGHRPTWSMGVKGEAPGAGRWQPGFQDMFGMFGAGFGPRSASAKAEEPRRTLRNLERKSFAQLDLEGRESGPEIKARYKSLVKRLHPDANGGDRTFEDRLREIIQAYNYLKAAGFC